MKEIYHSPIVETDQLFDVEAGDMSILARCWGLTSPNASGRATGDHLHFEIVENGQRQGRPS